MNDQEVPADFCKLPIPMPPMLPNVVGLRGDYRYFSLSYEGSKPFWSDGRAGGTFSYFAAYEPFISHPTIALHLFEADLGSDDGPPTHALLIDRQTDDIYVGDYDAVGHFLAKQRPPRCQPTPEEIEEVNRQLAEMEQMNFDQLRELGMFEFVLGPQSQQQERCLEMIAWLDGFITEELILSYIAAAETGEPLAFYHLRRFQERLRQLRDRANINNSSRWTH